MAQLAFNELTLPINPRPLRYFTQTHPKKKSLTRKSP
jgi:hypothetical protein